jgi:hypothetical protein
MNKPAAIFWTDEKLLEAAIGELLAHGGNKADIDLLRAEFQKANIQKANKSNNQAEPTQIEISGDVPA